MKTHFIYTTNTTTKDISNQKGNSSGRHEMFDTREEAQYEMISSFQDTLDVLHGNGIADVTVKIDTVKGESRVEYTDGDVIHIVSSGITVHGGTQTR